MVRWTLRTALFAWVEICLLTTVLWADSAPHLDEHNRLIVDGQPFFPLGLYVVHCTNGRYTEPLGEIAGSPFNTVMNYAINECGSEATIQQIDAYLDKLKSLNIKLIYSLKDNFGKGKKDIRTIRRKAGAFKGHPAVIGWYLNDELPPKYIPELKERYQAIKSLDPHRPVWSVHWNTKWLLAEADTTDVVGVDPYPIPNDPITWVSNMADDARKSGKPLWLVPQIFTWSDYPGDPRAKNGRPPTYEEMRAMTYLAINHGAMGLIYYSYFNIRDDKDHNRRWPQIQNIALEIKQLEPILLSTHQVDQNRLVSKNDSIDYTLMRKAGAYYLFAVNTRNGAVDKVSFQTSLLKAGMVVTVLFEEGRCLKTLKGGRFLDNFGPYDVHVYTWPVLRETAPSPADSKTGKEGLEGA